MKCKIMHESRGRMRIRMTQKRMTLEQADILEYYLRTVDGVTDVKVYDRTCDAVVFFCGESFWLPCAHFPTKAAPIWSQTTPAGS